MASWLGIEVRAREVGGLARPHLNQQAGCGSSCCNPSYTGDRSRRITVQGL
jgi:hypothetical protein